MSHLTKTCKYFVLPLLVITLLFTSIVLYNYWSGGIILNHTKTLSSPTESISVSKKTIALVIDGDSMSNSKALRHTLAQLIKLGWFTSVDIPSTCEFEDIKSLWDWAAVNLKSEYVTLRRNNMFSFNWSEANTQRLRDFLQSANGINKEPIDLILGMGNISGKVLASSSSRRPIVIINAKNPNEVGYTAGKRFSDTENLFVAINTGLSDKQIRMFYNLTNFTTLGIIYRDTPAGRADAGLASIHRLSAEYNFDVEKYILPTDNSEDALLRGINHLVANVDAIFLPELPGLTYKALPKLNIPILAQRIPSFSQQGQDLVSRGVLATYIYPDYTKLGEFYAGVIGQILNGVPPNSIPQTYTSDLDIYINNATANKIGYKLPYYVQRTARTIYMSIDSIMEDNKNNNTKTVEELNVISN